MTNTAEAIYHEYADKVSAYVRGKVGNLHEAEDLVSTVFLKIVQKLDSYDPAKASLSTWIYTITRNTVTDYFRQQRIHMEYMEYMDYETAALEENGEELLDSLADALLTLKERERDLIVLHYYKGHTLKRVAEMMGMSYINAKVLHKKAVNKLYAYLKKE